MIIPTSHSPHSKCGGRIDRKNLAKCWCALKLGQVIHIRESIPLFSLFLLVFDNVHNKKEKENSVGSLDRQWADLKCCVVRGLTELIGNRSWAVGYQELVASLFSWEARGGRWPVTSVGVYGTTAPAWWIWGETGLTPEAFVFSSGWSSWDTARGKRGLL